jgi:hypothetical protein
MKTFIAILFILILSSEGKTQTHTISSKDPRIDSKIQELRKNNVDTIICYGVDCIGSLKPRRPDTCLAYDIKYLLWSDNGKHYMQRFDECKNYDMSDLSKNVFDLLKNGYSRVKSDELKYPEYTINEKGKLKTYTSIVDHSCHFMLEIYAKDNVLKKDIDAYALETKYIVDGYKKYKNRNYNANQQSILNRLKILIQQSINDYNKKF